MAITPVTSHGTASSSWANQVTALLNSWDTAIDTSGTNMTVAGTLTAGAITGSTVTASGLVTASAGVTTNALTTTTLTLNNYGVGTWTSFTPVVTGTTTNPNFGSTGIVQGQFLRIGALAIVQFFLEFGGTGITAGAGSWYIQAPVFRNTTGIAYPFSFGAAETRGPASAKHTGWSLDWIDNLSLTLRWGNGASNLTIGATVPYTWASGNQISGYFAYRV
jgi:hypothetical protein